MIPSVGPILAFHIESNMMIHPSIPQNSGIIQPHPLAGWSVLLTR
jgi:hypothetical protein